MVSNTITFLMAGNIARSPSTPDWYLLTLIGVFSVVLVALLVGAWMDWRNG